MGYNERLNLNDMRTILILLVQLCFIQVNAQTWEEWTAQKKAQEKYQQQQLAALQSYGSYLKTGYKVMQLGLTSVQVNEDGKFNLHRDFIASLSTVNPKVKSYVKVGSIISLQRRILAETKQLLKGVKDADQFTFDELQYCAKVMDNLLRSSLENITALLTVLTSGELSMKDDERLQRIDAIYEDMQDKYSFVSSFSEEIGLLTVQRMRVLYDVEISRKIMGLTPRLPK